MQMASSSAAYLLPGPSPSIGVKSTLIKPTFPPLPPPPPTAIQSVHHFAQQHHFHHPIHRSSASLHSHQPYSRPPPNGDIFPSLTTVAGTGNGATLLTTNNTNINNNSSTPNVLTTINTDDNVVRSGSNGGGSGGSSGHSLSQSMESINNIGLSDDEVSTRKSIYARFHL